MLKQYFAMRKRYLIMMFYPFVTLLIQFTDHVLSILHLYS